MNYFQKKSLIIIFIILLSSVAIDLTKSTITESTGGIERNLEIANSKASIEQLSSIWNNLKETFHVFAGGQFSNFIILALCIFWLFYCDFKHRANIFIAIFLSIAILPLLFGEDLIQTRVLYDIPLQIPAGIALVFIKNRPFGNFFVISICLWLFAMSLNTSSNFI